MQTKSDQRPAQFGRNSPVSRRNHSKGQTGSVRKRIPNEAWRAQKRQDSRAQNREGNFPSTCRAGKKVGSAAPAPGRLPATKLCVWEVGVGAREVFPGSRF